MMKRWLKVVFRCWALLTLLLSGIIAVARTRSFVPLLPEVQQCSKGLCYLTIELGKTTLSDALMALETARHIREADGAKNHSLPYTINFYADQNNPTSEAIQTIRLIFSEQSRLPLGLFTARFGEPCAVDIDFRGVTLLYPSMYIGIISSDRRIRPDALVDFMYLTNNPTLCSGEVGGLHSHPWRGYVFYEAIAD